MSTGTNSDNLPIVSKGSECIGSVHKAFSLLAQKPCFCFEVDTYSSSVPKHLSRSTCRPLFSLQSLSNVLLGFQPHWELNHMNVLSLISLYDFNLLFHPLKLKFNIICARTLLRVVHNKNREWRQDHKQEVFFFCNLKCRCVSSNVVMFCEMLCFAMCCILIQRATLLTANQDKHQTKRNYLLWSKLCI